jgi:hypothetical protein
MPDTPYSLRIRMAHEIDADGVRFSPSSRNPGNALNQFEAELARIIAEETTELRAENERLRGLVQRLRQLIEDEIRANWSQP